jgi:hypothetical protein
MTKRESARLVKSIELLKTNTIALSRAVNFDELIRYIRQPGWTTLAELTFTQGVVDAMNTHIQLVGELSALLMKGGRAVSARR